MADYTCSAAALRKFDEDFPKAEPKVRPWMALSDAIGPMMLPFVVRPEAYPKIPFSAIGILQTPLSELTPRRGEMWILFCFRREALRQNATPLRSDGFALVLEWRKGRSDSSLLSSSFHRLATEVRRQLAISGWSIHPAFDRYGDRVSFTDAELFSDADHISNIASAWGALAAGLYCAENDRYPSRWPFPSLQWDERKREVLAVAGLREKVSVAQDCGAKSLVVEKRQVSQIRDLFKGELAGGDARRLPFLYGVSGSSDVRQLAETIAFGVERRGRSRRLALSAAFLTLSLGIAAFVGQGHFARVRLEKETFENARRWIARGSESKPSEEELRCAWRSLRGLTQNRDVRSYLAGQLSARDWLLPVDVIPADTSRVRFDESELRCISKDISEEDAERPLCYREASRQQLLMRQIWVPDGFPILYSLLDNEVAAFDAGGTNALKWVSGISRQRSLRETAVKGVTALRISPDGLLGVVEAAEPEPTLIALDPFSGSEHWRMPVGSPVSAFCFGNSCERLAYGTQAGAVRVILSTGEPLGQELKFGCRIDAVRFDPGDDVLHVLVGGSDVSCAVVVQDHEGATMPPPDCGSAATAAAFLDVIDPEQTMLEPAIESLKNAPGVFGAFMRFAAKPIDRRPINIFSSTEYGEWAQANLDDEMKVLRMRPDDARAAMHNWLASADQMARLQAMDRLGCHDYIDPKLLSVRFYDDPQVMWSSDHLFRYVLSRNPGDAEATDLCERIFLRESGCGALRKPAVFSGPQAEQNMRIRKLYLDQMEVKWLAFLLEKEKRKCAFAHEDAARRFAPDPSDDAVGLWGKMLKNLHVGTDAGALACFEAFVRKNDPAELRISEYAPAVRLYVRERKRLGLNGGVLVLGFEAPATSHPNLKVGDIIVEVDGVPCRTDSDYMRAVEGASAGRPLLTVFRIKPDASAFERMSFQLLKGPRIGIRSLAEVNR